METLDLDTKLTPAARQVLEEIVSEYLTQILVGAKESASELTGEVREISVHDIIGGINRSRPGRPSPLPSMIERVLNIYMVTGIVVGLTGLFVFLYFGWVRFLRSEQQLPLLASITGFGLSVLSYLSLRIRQSKGLRGLRLQPPVESRGIDYSMSYIQKWQDIELTARNLVASRLGESSANEPVSVLIAKLREAEILNRDDENQLRELVAVRNRVLHEGFEVDRNQFEMLLRDGDRILAKMVKYS